MIKKNTQTQQKQNKLASVRMPVSVCVFWQAKLFFKWLLFFIILSILKQFWQETFAMMET